MSDIETPTPTSVVVQSALEAARARLHKSARTEDKVQARYIKMILDGEQIADRQVFFEASVAVALHAPIGTSDEQLQHLLISAGRLGMDPRAVADARAGAAFVVEQRAARAREVASLDGFKKITTGPKTGQIDHGSEHNIRVALNKLGVEVQFNAFSEEEEVVREGERAIIDDSHLKVLRNVFEREFAFKPSKDDLWDTVSVIARENSYHPVVDYLDDVDERLACATDELSDLPSTWLIRFGGAEDTPYVRAVSQLMLVAAVRRVRQPGCLFQEMMVLESPEQGKGKCLQRGTRVVMYDGTTRAVEDVREGELLMGPDSTPRRVLGTTSGTGPLRRIVPTKGDAWTCNDQHVLTVALHGGDGLRDAVVTDFAEHKWGSYHVPSKKYAMLVRSSCIEFPECEVRVDPYLVGAWLGDGTKAAPHITNVEPEIHEYCADGTPQQYHRGSPNPLMKFFRTCVVNDEKRIPREYLVNSERVRLELLAGLIDTDGSLGNNTYCITTKYQGLRDDILFLARSLGLAAYSSLVDKTIKSLGFRGQYHSIKISGHINRVPVKVARKRAAPRKQVKNVLRTGFQVEDVGVGEYFGFELDGDSRFLLEDFTITHNSSALRVLAVRDEWFTDDFTLQGDSKKMIEQTSGRWFVEAGELRGMSQGDHNAMKQYLSRTHDRARMSYDRKVRWVARQFVQFATTNDEVYLKDPTGNRRIWPIRIKEFDIEGLRAARDRIWAEASRLERENPAPEFIRLDQSLYGAAAEEQGKREFLSPYFIRLEDALGDAVGRILVEDVYKLVGFVDEPPNKPQAMEISTVMQALRFKADRMWVGSKRKRVYARGTEAERGIMLKVVPINNTFQVRASQVAATSVGTTAPLPALGQEN